MKCKTLFSAVAVAVALLAAPASADLVDFDQNFEGLDISSPSALTDDGWLVFGNVFDPGGGYLYGYGPFGAPNGGAGFSAVATGEGGPNQGAQYINIYSDYNNNDHNNGNTVEGLTFQEQTVGAVDLGETYDFTFDYKANSTAAPGGSAITSAFVKVLDPGNSFAQVYFDEQITTGAPTATWTEGNTISLAIDNAWSGHIVQFGFRASSTNFDPTGVFYDNVTFANAASVPEPGSALILGLGFGVVMMRRRRG